MAKPFDAASKHLIESRPRDWIALAGFPVPPSDHDVSIVDADLSNVMTTAADKLIRVDNPPGLNKPYLAHVEFQSSADSALDARVLLCNILSRRRHGLPVWSAVFLLRPQAMVAGINGCVRDKLDDIAQLDFSYHLIRVLELSTQSVLDGGIGVLPLAPITAVGTGELASVVESVKQRLTSSVPQQQGKEFLLAMRVLMGLKYQEQLTETLMQSIAEMTDSVEWQKIFRSGRVEGKAEGKAEGFVEGEQALLQRLGTQRFGPPSEPMLRKLRSIQSTEQLSDLASRLLIASSWEDLLGS